MGVDASLVFTEMSVSGFHVLIFLVYSATFLCELSVGLYWLSRFTFLTWGNL